MRRAMALLLTALTLALPFAGLLGATPAPAAIAPSTPISLGYGPHLMVPNPDVYPRVPFVQPAGWTGTPPGTRGVGTGTRATGTQDALVILVEFTDVTATRSSADIGQLANDPTPGAASVRNYYQEVSYGTFGLQSTVTPWFRSSFPMSEYGADGAQFDDLNGPIYRLVIEAVQLADASTDFASFDGDANGVVDHVVVVHAGDAQESNGGNANLIWSHRWSVVDANPSQPGNQRLQADGVQIYGYIMVSEFSPVGVYVHELGHDLGLPDLYDTDGSSEGIGVWGVMGSGSWNGSPRGTMPAHMSAWSRIELDWITPIPVTSPLLGQVIDQAETTPQAFKLPIGPSGAGEEYFLVENRQQVGFDAGLPAAGLLIWHVDEGVQGNEDDVHRLVDLEEADGNDRPTQVTDAWADDPLGFGPDSTPDSNSYLNQRTGWKVRNIGPTGVVMVADLSREVDDDLLIAEIRRPCCAPVGGMEQIGVTLANRGSRNQTDVAVNLTVYLDAYDPAAAVCCGGKTVSLLAQGASQNLTWDVPVAAAGKYILEASVPLAMDEIPENNQRFAHFAAAGYDFFDDVEAGNVGWTRNGNPTDPAVWDIVQDTVNETVSHSRSHAWRFGPVVGPPSLCPPSCPPDFHSLTSVPVGVTGAPVYLYLWHRYDLTGRNIDNVTSQVETDTAFVNVSVDGVWRTVATFQNAQPNWDAVFADLGPWVSGPATIVVEFSASSQVVQQSGGWWVDDIAIADAPLLPGLVARPVDREVTVEPGGVALFRFKLANVGDFDDEVSFALQAPAGWVAAIGQNQTRMQSYDAYRARLRPDSEATLLLGFQVAVEAQRGSRFTVPVTATSTLNTSVQTTFETVTVINDPFGLAGLERYVFLFLIVFAAVIVIAVVVDAVKKQRGVYRRW